MDKSGESAIIILLQDVSSGYRMLAVLGGLDLPDIVWNAGSAKSITARNEHLVLVFINVP